MEIREESEAEDLPFRSVPLNGYLFLRKKFDNALLLILVLSHKNLSNETIGPEIMDTFLCRPCDGKWLQETAEH